MKAKEVIDMTEELRIVVDFDEYFSPVGEAAGLLAGVCGLMAINPLIFPINVDKWPDLPDELFLDQWDAFFMVKLSFCIGFSKLF